jgi:type II secretory pathway pseudopilin PulG
MRSGSRLRAAARALARTAPPARAAGFTYLAVLLLVALIGLGLSSAATLFATAQQRERELELLFAGNQYRQAIGSYYESTPGGAKQFPPTLEALLKDERHPVTVRHLRKLYRDPMTGKPDWVLVSRPDNRIAGVASRSKARPFKTDNFSNPLDRDFRGAASLSEWHFVYSPALAPGSAPNASQPEQPQRGGVPVPPSGSGATPLSPLFAPPSGSPARP